MINKERQNRKNTFGLLKGLAVFLLGLTLLSGCSALFGKASSNQSNVSSSSQKEIVYINVRLRSDDEVYEDYTFVEGTIFPRPSFIPTKTNHTFVNWYSKGMVHDFSKPLYNDTSIIAKFSLDKALVRTVIRANQLKANVKVVTKRYNTTFFGLFETDVVSGQGSGVIFGTSESNYWLLTNSHVVDLADREKRSFSIIDYKNNEYSATLHAGSEMKYYDLATLYFKKGKESLTTIKLASNDGVVGHEVIAIGQPKGEMNVITFGVITGYRSVGLRDEEDEPVSWNSPFACIIHSAKTDRGSSGGMLINHDLELVGIHVGSGGGYSITIPILQVRKYLNTYVYT